MMRIKQYIPDSLKLLYKKLKAPGQRKYKIGDYIIDLPAGYNLPELQSTIKLYDRYLPVLVKELDAHGTIIDIGANIGDTTIAMVSNCKNDIVAIEPSDVFFPYLERNIKYLSREDQNRIKTIKAFVGTGKLSGTLTHFGSTASLNVSNPSDVNSHMTLDDLVGSLSDVKLIKVDTDGFDFDVISSADKIITRDKPILFWENEINEEFQLKGFLELYSWLESKDYNHIFIFDNFGNLITEELNFNTLKNINTYLFSMKKSASTRTFFYTDVLACTQKNYSAVKNAGAAYLKYWINKNETAED